MTTPSTQSHTNKPASYTFVYKDVEYDATHYLEKHPGGPTFIQNMKEERTDFTEYFKSLHSKKAERILESFPVAGRATQTEASRDYFRLLSKVQHLYQPIWIMEVGIWLMLALMLYIAHTSDLFVVSVAMFTLQQIIVGWQSHSNAHSRNSMVVLLGTVLSGLTQRMASLLGGYSISWWSPKHNMHHMFTNTKHDGDIQHEYKVYLYPFLYLKWRFDSIEESIRNFNFVDLLLIITNYVFLYLSGRWLSFLVGMLIGGFYAAFVLIGNHERETRINTALEGQTFVDHQLTTCRNYRHKGFWWLMVMGGMQYQTEHHLFPQIPFYRLPEAEDIIADHLEAQGRKICYGPVL